MQLSALRTLCELYTELPTEDIARLEGLESQISVVAELTETDIFIDALTHNGIDAIVLAWARPGQRSLYQRSVVGELAYATREPAVFQALSTGKTVRHVRGVSQEGTPIAQTVVPQYGTQGKIIGVLIMEKDISHEIRQEEQVEFLSQAAEGLSNTLMSFSMMGSTWEEWLGNGIFVLNLAGTITYANNTAARMYREYWGSDPLSGDILGVLKFSSVSVLMEGLSSPMEYSFGSESYMVQAHPLVSYGELSGCVLSLQDVTELRRKEKQLNAQSALIREIHHRVKNNLQNVVALLRLQMNRSKSKTVKKEFAASINRVLSFAQVHDVFARQSWDSIDLLELTEYLLIKLVDNYRLPGQSIQASVQGQPVRVSASQAVPMALVINELVTNSLKHGVQSVPVGAISVLVEESEGTVHMLVVDSGAYLELPAPEQTEGHLGLTIVKLMICEQLGGTFQLERRGGSTVAKVSFPLSRAED